MDIEAVEMDDMEEGRLKTNWIGGGKPDGSPAVSPPPDEVRIVQETARYNEVQGTAGTGSGMKLDELLNGWQEQEWLRDWRNEENLTLYAEAITDGYLDVIKVLLKYNIPLGDALIRAIDLEFDDAIKSICQYLQRQEGFCEADLDSHCDNGDFHPAMTPLVLAAQRNNFGTVQLLLELGAEIVEPTISLGGDVNLTQAISTLHIYRAISQPAFILATQTDIFGHAFEMSTKLRALSRSWTDFGVELEELARRVELFAGEMLGQSASTEEILALFRYHSTDKYRDAAGKQHPLSKMFEAIKHQQKEFIAHPHSQKAIIVQFYRNILDWNEKGFLYTILLVLMVLLGYPIISFLYIFVPVRKVVNFARQPYVMFLMNAGSGFTFIAFIVAVTICDKTSYPRTADALYVLIFIWVIGLAWLHIKRIMKHGAGEYLSSSNNLHEAIIIALYITVFFLQWNGPIHISPNVLVLRRSAGDGTCPNDDSFSDLQCHVASALGDLRGNLSDTVVEGVNGILMASLSNCRPDNPIGDAVSEAAPPLPSSLQKTVAYDQFEPIIVANTLFGVTIIFSILNLMNLLLVNESVGPLRISLGGMVDDILKFCCVFLVIWIAFAIGLFQNYYSARQSITRACTEGGDATDECDLQTGFSTLISSALDLYWSLFGLVELEAIVLPAKYSVAEAIGTFLYFMYHIAAVLVLLNALIGMLSNTYNHTEEYADTEWKFHRAAVWATYLRPVGTLPPPFNLIPSVKSVFRFCRYIVGIWLQFARRKVVNRKAMHSKREFDDYMRVLKLTRDRYIQVNLSTTSMNSEEVRPRDIQSLRNDVMTFRLIAQERLDALNKNLVISEVNSTYLSRKLEDLDPLTSKASGLVNENLDLTDNTGVLSKEINQLEREQTTELVRVDEEVSGMRGRIAALLAEAEKLKSDHSSEISEDRQVAKLKDIIQGLGNDKTDLTSTLNGLLEDKNELMNTVDVLQEEIKRIMLLVPEPESSGEEEMDEETAERIGFFWRIKNIVTTKLSDISQDVKAVGKVDDNSGKETDQIQMSEYDMTLEEQNSDPELTPEESLESRAEPEIQKGEESVEPSQEQNEKLELEQEPECDVEQVPKPDVEEQQKTKPVQEPESPSDPDSQPHESLESEQLEIIQEPKQIPKPEQEPHNKPEKGLDPVLEAEQEEKQETEEHQKTNQELKRQPLTMPDPEIETNAVSMLKQDSVQESKEGLEEPAQEPQPKQDPKQEPQNELEQKLEPVLEQNKQPVKDSSKTKQEQELDRKVAHSLTEPEPIPKTEQEPESIERLAEPDQEPAQEPKSEPQHEPEKVEEPDAKHESDEQETSDSISEGVPKQEHELEEEPQQKAEPGEETEPEGEPEIWNL